MYVCVCVLHRHDSAKNLFLLMAPFTLSWFLFSSFTHNTQSLYTRISLFFVFFFVCNNTKDFSGAQLRSIIVQMTRQTTKYHALITNQTNIVSFFFLHYLYYFFCRKNTICWIFSYLFLAVFFFFVKDPFLTLELGKFLLIIHTSSFSFLFICTIYY